MRSEAIVCEIGPQLVYKFGIPEMIAIVCTETTVTVAAGTRRAASGWHCKHRPSGTCPPMASALHRLSTAPRCNRSVTDLRHAVLKVKMTTAEYRYGTYLLSVARRLL